MIAARRRLMMTSAMAAIAGLGFLTRNRKAEAAEVFAVQHTEAEWHKLLDANQFAVLREAGTERPFTSKLLHEERAGKFACAGCDQDAFSSSTKYDSQTGWPSFWKALDNAVGIERDTSYGMIREAVHCSNCGGHLGHLFDDGPKPTGLRYCMNGVALTFKPDQA